MPGIFSTANQNFVQKQLDATLAAGATSLTLSEDVSALFPDTSAAHPTTLVVDRVDSNGAKTSTKREIITFTTVSGANISGLTRNADGSGADQEHAVGAVVEFVPDVLWAKSMVDNFADTSSAQDFTNKTLTTPIIASMYQDAGKTKLMTVPDTASDTLAALNATQELKNKTIAGANNTISGITEAMLTLANNTTGNVSATAHGFAPMFPDNTTTFLRGDGTYAAPAAALSSKVMYYTRDMTAASGDVAYTSVGFTPKAIIFFTWINATATGASVGLVGSGVTQNGVTLVVNGASNFSGYANTNSACFIANNGSAGTDQTAKVKSLDADGFTLTWTKNGTPTGTLGISALCLG